MTRRTSLLLALLAAGCSISVETLAPFPCAQDGTCPASLECRQGLCQQHEVTCEERGDCPQGDGGPLPYFAPVGPWSACLAPTSAYGSCAEYCDFVGADCVEACSPPNRQGIVAVGAAAWQPADGCSGVASGQASCTFAWNDVIGAAPRWECCCQQRDAGSDAGSDAGEDGGLDAGQDAGFDAGEDAGPDAGDDAGFDAGPWSACVGSTSTFHTCDQYCATVGKACQNACDAPGGSQNQGAIAWQYNVDCQGAIAGQASCSYDWIDPAGTAPRWECCCR